MATIRGNQTLTVNAATREYAQAYVPAYSKAIASGNTVVKQVAITGGESFLRISHETTNGLERHVVSIEDRINGTSPGEITIRKIQLTITSPITDSTSDTALKQLAIGFLDHLQDDGRLQDVLNGALN